MKVGFPFTSSIRRRHYSFPENDLQSVMGTKKVLQGCELLTGLKKNSIRARYMVLTKILLMFYIGLEDWAAGFTSNNILRS